LSEIEEVEPDDVPKPDVPLRLLMESITPLLG